MLTILSRLGYESLREDEMTRIAALFFVLLAGCDGAPAQPGGMVMPDMGGVIEAPDLSPPLCTLETDNLDSCVLAP